MTAIHIPQEEHVSPFSRILVAIDGSDASIHAAHVAIRVAAVHHLPVILLYVVADKTVEEMAAMSGNPEDTVRRQLEAKGYSYLEHIVRIAKGHDVDSERVLRHGAPHSQVADVARDRDVDLIVIGETRGQSSRRAFVGSLTEQIIEYVPCTVLVVKPDST